MIFDYEAIKQEVDKQLALRSGYDKDYAIKQAIRALYPLEKLKGMLHDKVFMWLEYEKKYKEIDNVR